QLSAPNCNPGAYTSPFPDEPFLPFDSIKANIYRYRQQRSVNLGSWFVHEKWMTPSLWDCASGPKISEADIAYGWGSIDGARAVLERHWDTFITQEDLDYLASIGINTVRLPIGYWNLGPGFTGGTLYDPVGDVYKNSWVHVVRAINMAAKAGIGVLVDLHGAVGSQNGQDHSGVSDKGVWLFSIPANMDKTIAVLTYLTQQLTYVTNVVGIQILNEPVDDPGLWGFYDRAIAAMRATLPEACNLPLYIHDAFNLGKYSGYVAQHNDFVVLDHHSYFVYTPRDASESAHKHTSDIEMYTAADLSHASATTKGRLVVDEFSCALTQQSLAKEADQDGARRAFCSGQDQVYLNSTAGWAFWSYMKEDCENDKGWCFRAAVGDDLPATFFSYGNDKPTDEQLGALSSVLTSAPPVQQASVEQLSLDSTEADSRDGPYDSPDAASGRGYSDGFSTAKIFAAHGLSKLGFVEQYITDSMLLLHLPEGSEGYYRDAFIAGLRDGENRIAT
ncbi:glycoside hydrolase, partial [Punctularia strigosozonata HHB-11173 SS5]|uniref:glycoside hydrolase n=1 Tax=Punctularia strigosozonata (strain HHB-11173) TaxID=741275 RepID=UPI0004417A1C